MNLSKLYSFLAVLSLSTISNNAVWASQKEDEKDSFNDSSYGDNASVIGSTIKNNQTYKPSNYDNSSDWVSDNDVYFSIDFICSAGCFAGYYDLALKNYSKEGRAWEEVKEKYLKKLKLHLSSKKIPFIYDEKYSTLEICFLRDMNLFHLFRGLAYAIYKKDNYQKNSAANKARLTDQEYSWFTQTVHSDIRHKFKECRISDFSITCFSKKLKELCNELMKEDLDITNYMKNFDSFKTAVKNKYSVRNCKPFYVRRSEVCRGKLVTKDYWVLSINRLKKKFEPYELFNQHAFLILEGFDFNQEYKDDEDVNNNEFQPVTFFIDLVRSRSKGLAPRQKYPTIEGYANVRLIKYKGQEKLIHKSYTNMMNVGDYKKSNNDIKIEEVLYSMGRNISVEEAKALIRDVKKDQKKSKKKKLYFLLPGKNSLPSRLGSSEDGYNCFTWAKEKVHKNTTMVIPKTSVDQYFGVTGAVLGPSVVKNKCTECAKSIVQSTIVALISIFIFYCYTTHKSD